MRGADGATLNREHYMPNNLGTAERLLRVVAGVLLLRLYGALASPWRYLTLVGIVLLATALRGYCPLYQVAGIRTCSSTPDGSSHV